VLTYKSAASILGLHQTVIFKLAIIILTPLKWGNHQCSDLMD